MFNVGNDKTCSNSNKGTRGMCKICLISFPNQLTFLNNGKKITKAKLIMSILNIFNTFFLALSC